VYWAAPPYANQPRRPIHLLVGLNTANPGKDIAVRYNVGDMYGSEINAGTHIHSWQGDKIIFAVVCDASFGSKGYWSSWNTLLSKDQAKNEPYAERMSELFAPWVKSLSKRMPVKPAK
jgi:hypothetical protein